MVFWMLWRCGLLEDFSDLAAAATAPEAFPAPLDALVVAPLKVGDAVGPPNADGPGPPATETSCPTVAMALILSLGRVLVEPME